MTPTNVLDETVTTGDEGQAVQLDSSTFAAEVILDAFNRRLTIRRYRGEVVDLANHARDLAAEHHLTKVFVRAPEADWTEFVAQGFVMEGLLPCHFAGEPAFCLARFLSGERRISGAYDREDTIFREVMDEPVEPSPAPTEGFAFARATNVDAEELAAVYDAVFETYPSPLHRAEYIRATMNEDEIFWVCRHRGRIVSAAAGAVEEAHGSAEMTACATLPAFRGRGLMQALLAHLETHLVATGYRCLYSMARAKSPGMNRAFRRLGYRYQGRLINHCHIMGDFEDMNLWVHTHRPLPPR